MARLRAPVASSNRRRSPLRPRRLGFQSLERRALLATFPSGFVSDTVVSGLNQALALDFAPDGRMFLAEKAGVVRVVQDGTLLSAPFVDIQSQVNNVHDRGMLGLAVHPQFPDQPYVYVSYTYDPPGAAADAPYSRVARVSRFTADAAAGFNRALPGSELVLVGAAGTLANIPSPGQANPAQPACGPIGAYVQDCIPADEISHTIGRLQFAPDGSLLVASGDGANFSVAQDYAVRAIDPDSLSGKLLRIHPLTGEGYANNPLFDGDFASNRSKVYDFGLRNPYRFTVDPVTAVPYIGDVGWGVWEELDRGAGANFGWPCYEGASGTLQQTGPYASLPQCQALYAAGGVTPAIYAYQHAGQSSAIGAGAFYEGTVYPPAYRDALFLFDYSRQEIRAATFGPGRTLLGVTTFGTAVGGIVDLTAGPDTNLYYLDVFTGRVQRLRYTGGGNAAPTAVAAMSQTAAGTFDFSGAGSFDPNGDLLEYFWDFGDGATSTLANPSHSYAAPGTYVASLRVADPEGLFHVDDHLRPIAGNTPPVAAIDSPGAAATYRIGDVISLLGVGTDADDGTLPAASLRWEVRLHHAGHVHFDYYNATGPAASFTAADHEDDSYFEIRLTVTDSVGVSTTVSRDLLPQLARYTFNSIPSGLALNYSGVDAVTPFTRSIVVGATRSIVAPATQPGGWTFGNWSDGGAATHNFTAAAAPAPLVARYENPARPGSVLAVRAAGDTGQEQIELQIDQAPVASFALTTELLDYYYVHPAAVSGGQVRVAFTNDLFQPPLDRNARIDQVAIDGVALETEAGSVFSTGTWDPVGGCGPGNKQSEYLHCQGYFQYAAASPATTTLVVRAAGDTGQERIELQVAGATVATFDLTTTPQDFVYVHDGTVTAEQVRVAFINDFFQPPVDYNVTIDRLVVNGTIYETESATVYSTGTWDPVGGCSPGYKQSQSLHCGGYFQFEATAQQQAAAAASPAPDAQTAARPKKTKTSSAKSRLAAAANKATRSKIAPLVAVPSPAAVDAVFSHHSGTRSGRRRR